MKGYAFIEKDRVVVNEKRKPELDPGHYSQTDVNEWVNNVLSAWEDSCYEVENAQYKCIIFGGKKWLIIDVGKNEIPIISNYEDGQPVDFTLSGKKAVINKID